jgi:aryl-alcohol dehydrogenase-like predicted oxidoreductase
MGSELVSASSSAQRIPLGASGLAVAPLGWGMWRFAGVDLASARARVDAALEIGCTLLDTADVYGHGPQGGFGAAEELLGKVLRAEPSIRAGIVLATKAGIRPPVPYDSSTVYLVQACEASLRRLGVEQLDLLQVHRPDVLAHPAEVARAFDTLHRQGKIRAAGVSNYSATQTRALLAHLTIPLASLQPEFSALALAPLEDGILDLALERGIAVLAWSPLAQGRLGVASDAKGLGADASAARVIAALDAKAARIGIERTALAYSWIMAHPARPIPLIGSQSPARIRALAAAYGVAWTRTEWYSVLAAARGAPLP